MCACVITMALTVSPWRCSTSRMLSISSPGSITIASRVASSPKIEQLHWSIPTGRISWIIYRDCILTCMGDVLTTLMRWLHLSSVATLIGGLIYARFVIAPSESFLPGDAHLTLDDRAAAHFRPIVFTAIACLVISGLFNYATHPGHSTIYHALF